jgi:uncharacterized membrane protein
MPQKLTGKQSSLVLNQIESWRSQDLIDDTIANRLLNDTKERTDRDSGSKTITIFSVFGGLLIGIGIITLLAFNWESLGRPVRVVIAYLPLLIAQALTVFILLNKKRASKAWCEGTAAFYVAAVGAAISLIAQTYHLHGYPEGFFLSWSLLVLPVIYLLNSVFACLAYLLGISIWYFVGHGIYEFEGWVSPDLYYWLLLAPAGWFVFQRCWRPENSDQSFLLTWGSWFAVCSCFVATVANSFFVGESDELGVAFLGLLFGLLFLTSEMGFFNARSLFMDPPE